jgi:hypothetical protein
MESNRRRERGAEIGPHQLRAIGVEAVVDVRTLRRFLQGERVRSTSEFRIRRAMATLGLDIQRARAGGSR